MGCLLFVVPLERQLIWYTDTEKPDTENSCVPWQSKDEGTFDR